MSKSEYGIIFLVFVSLCAAVIASGCTSNNQNRALDANIKPDNSSIIDTLISASAAPEESTSSLPESPETAETSEGIENPTSDTEASASAAPEESTSSLPELPETAETSEGIENPAAHAHAVPVLLYHDLAPAEECLDNTNGLIVPVEEFRSQMSWLKEHEYVTPTLSEFLSWINGENELPSKSVLITFDDGYISLKTHALPILEECGLTAVVFVIGERADGIKAGLCYFSWDDISSINASEVADFQNHTYDGHNGPTSNPEIASWPPERFSEDLEAFEEGFEDHGLDRPFAFAYPFGFKTDTMVDVLSKHGYQLAFTTKHDFVHPGDNPLEVSRIIIWPETTLVQFEQRITPKPSH